MSGKEERPEALVGSTYRINTGYGKLYVNINEDSTGQPFEVLVYIGQSGGIMNSMAEAIGKLASNALRSGADPEEVANDLIGIRSPKMQIDNGDEIQSIPDAVGVAMKRHIEGTNGSVKGE